MKSVIALVLGFFSASVLAAQCTDVFPDAASSASPTGSIRFQPNARLTGTDGAIDFASMTDNAGGYSCSTQACQLSGSASSAITLPTFEDANSTQDLLVRYNTSESLAAGNYDEVRLESNAILTTSTDNGTYKIRSLHIGGSARVTLASGTYWIDQLTTDNYTILAPATGAKVTLYVKQLSTSTNSQINASGSASDVTVFSYGDVSIGQYNYVKAFIYADGEVEYATQSQHYGSVSASSVVLNDYAQVQYQPDDVVNIAADGMCTIPVTLPDPIGDWPIDACALTGSNTEVIDIANGNAGEAVNSPVSDAQGHFCQAAYFRGEGDIISIPHNSAYAIDNGSVSLWVKVDDLSFTNRASNGGMAIFSKDSAGLDSGGHLTLYVTDSGAIKVVHQNTSASTQLTTTSVITEGQWQHVVYTFGADGMQVYVDGQLVGENTSFTDGLSGNSEPIVLAGSAAQTGNGVSPSDELVDLYQGRIDDLKLFDAQLSADQVSLLFGEEAGSCSSCESGAQLISHWDMDVCSVTGTGNEVIDVENGHNGAVINGADISSAGKYCQAAEFDDQTAHINIPNDSALQPSSGSLAFWFNADALPSSGRAGLWSKDSDKYDSGDQLTISVNASGQIVVDHQSNGSNKDGLYAVTSATVTTNSWHLFVYTFSGSSVKYYLDGVYLGAASSSLSLNKNKEPIILGASAEKTGNNVSAPQDLLYFFDGRIDDVRLYGDVLTDADVQLLYTQASYTCDSCSGTPPLLLYHFEQQEWTASGDVTDSSGNNYNGDALGTAQPVTPTNSVSCRVLDVPYNSSRDTIDAVDTTLDLNTIGETGTISFWYKSNKKWHDGGDRMLLDASRHNTESSDRGRRDEDEEHNTNKYFYLLLTDEGSLEFALEDDNDKSLEVKTKELSVAKNEWVHVAISWSLSSNSAKVFVNASDQSKEMEGRVSSSLGELGTLTIGDNGTTSNVNGTSGRSANGQFDDVRVYNYVQTQAQIAADMADVSDCDSSVHHYYIQHDTQALTCSTSDVLIKACANAACDQLVDGNVTASLYLGDSLVSNATFDGQTTFTLSHTTAESLTLAVQGGDSVSVPASDATCNQGCDIDFVDAGFQFFNASAPYSTSLPDVVAESSMSAIGLRAVSSNNGVCSALLTGEQTVTLGFDCVSSSDTDYSADQCQVPFAGVSVQGDGSGTSSGSVTLTFNASGEATFAGYQYADAGRVALTASASIDDVAITSGSTTLDSIPDSLQLSSNLTSPSAAGGYFTLSISAQGAAGNVLPGYQGNTMQALFTRNLPTSDSAADGALFVSDSSSVTSALSPGYQNVTLGNFTAGSYEYEQAYVEEVGEYSVSVRDNDYLGNVITSNSVSLGRFTPAYFDVQPALTPVFASACSDSFTYVGQTFAFTTGLEPAFEVTAYNARHQVTRNYSGDYWTLAPSTGSFSGGMTATDNGSYSGDLSIETAASDVQFSDTDSYDGAGTITVLGSAFAFEKEATPVPPFNTDVTLSFAAAIFTDSDGICYQTDYPSSCAGVEIESVQGTTQRYGRLRLENTFGPENESLRVPLLAEYYNNNGWMTNTLDSCTDITLSTSGGAIVVEDASSDESEQDITDLLSEVSASGTLVSGKSGSDDLVFAPPLNDAGEGVIGSVRVSLPPDSATWSAYLNIDWNLDGVIDSSDTPDAVVSFGLFRGNDRTLYWREQTGQ